MHAGRRRSDILGPGQDLRCTKRGERKRGINKGLGFEGHLAVRDQFWGLKNTRRFGKRLGHPTIRDRVGVGGRIERATCPADRPPDKCCCALLR
eukprot:272771-Chlamydomonas_euryale.AAC.1